MEDCIFCKIAKHEISADIVYEDENIICFRDIHPLAPVHVLVVPKLHFESLCKVDNSNVASIEKAFLKIPEIVDMLGIKESGFRTIINTGKHGIQTVKHMHIHILGGKQFSNKMGENTSL